MLKEISEKFIGKSVFFEINEIGGGNINKSFLICANTGKYVLQKINNEVFTEPFTVMSNILKVCSHLKSKNIGSLTFLNRIDNNSDTVDSYLVNEGNTFWRCMRFIEHSGQCSCASNCKLANLTGYAFGKFIFDCSDMDVALSLSIPNFHNLPDRIQTLNNIYHKKDRIKTNNLSESVYKKIFSLLDLVNCSLRNNLPDRITHNDTKIANLLFNEEQITVIDLDTVMPGKITDDFGDSARSVASSVGEDEKDVSKIFFDIRKFAAFTSGFFRGVSNILTSEEIRALPFAPAYVTAELACRFLTDYYNGNKYFVTSYPEHNLDRARNQTILLNDILNKQQEIKNVVNSCAYFFTVT